jgi:hypothetical protein
MSDRDFEQLQSWLITEGLKNWNTRVTEARLALARVVPYVAEVENLWPSRRTPAIAERIARSSRF